MIWYGNSLACALYADILMCVFQRAEKLSCTHAMTLRATWVIIKGYHDLWPHLPLIPGGLLIFYLQILYWFWSDCVKLWHDLSLQFPCLGLSQHLCLPALKRLIKGSAGAFIAMSHLWTYDWLLVYSEIGNVLGCDCFVKHPNSIYYKGHITLVSSCKNIWHQSSTETVLFRHTGRWQIKGKHKPLTPPYSGGSGVSVNFRGHFAGMVWMHLSP